MLLAGCGATHKQRLSTSTEPTTALADAYDNAHLDGDWSCSLLRKAVAQLSLSPDAYTPIARMVGQAEGQACDRALARVHRGLTPAQVDALLGRPDDAARCRLYRWMPDADSSPMVPESASSKAACRPFRSLCTSETHPASLASERARRYDRRATRRLGATCLLQRDRYDIARGD